MSVSEFSSYEEKINLNQFLYVFLIASIIIVGVIALNLFKNTVSLELDAFVSDNKVIELSNLNKVEVSSILNSKRLIIQNKVINYQIIEIKESNDNYLLKLSLDKIYLKEEILKIKFILKEEKLYKFIYETVKGDI